MPSDTPKTSRPGITKCYSKVLIILYITYFKNDTIKAKKFIPLQFFSNPVTYRTSGAELRRGFAPVFCKHTAAAGTVFSGEVRAPNPKSPLAHRPWQIIRSHPPGVRTERFVHVKSSPFKGLFYFQIPRSNSRHIILFYVGKLHQKMSFKFYSQKTVRHLFFSVHTILIKMNKTLRVMNRKALEERLIDFAVLIAAIVNEMPNTRVSNHFASQLIRSGTSPALNYGETQSAESKKDFVHKMSVVLKELRESLICLTIIYRTNSFKSKTLISKARDECNQLVSIFVKSLQTARKHM